MPASPGVGCPTALAVEVHTPILHRHLVYYQLLLSTATTDLTTMEVETSTVTSLSCRSRCLIYLVRIT